MPTWREAHLAAGATATAARRSCATGAAAEEPLDAASMVRLEHLDPARPVLCGATMAGERPPVAFLSARAEELLTYVREDPKGPFADPLEPWPDWLLSTRHPLAPGARPPVISGRWRQWGFQFSPKEPFIMKADWHCVDSWGEAHDLFVPRMDSAASVRRAPPRVVAFMEAFRRANAGCWSDIAEALERLRLRACRHDPDCAALAGFFAETIRKQGIFSVIEAQAGPGQRLQTMRSHKDGATSLLHLGLTLGGRRKLSSQLQAASAMRTVAGWLETDMAAGSVYLSSPFLFEHAVQYEPCDEHGPTLALMCRFGFAEDDAMCVNQLRDSRMFHVATTITESLGAAASRGELRLPTLAEVASAEARTGVQTANGARPPVRHGGEETR